MADNFTQAIMSLRRRAQLQGRPLSQRELTGISEGAASTADERASRLKSLELQKERDAEAKRQYEQNMRYQREQDDKAEDQQEKQDMWSFIGAGFSIGSSVGGPVGGVAGGAVGGLVYGMSSGSFFCTEVDHMLGLPDGSDSILRRFKAYVGRNHKEWLGLYLRSAPKAVEQIYKENYGLTVFRDMKQKMVLPVIELVKDGMMEEAYQVYKEYAGNIIKQYAPQYGRAIEELEHGCR